MIVRRPADTTPRLTVTFPASMSAATEDQVAQRLSTALGCGITPVIADLTKTASCDPGTIRLLANAARQAAQHGIELRLAAPAGAVRCACTLTGLDMLLSIYCSLDEALSGAPAPQLPTEVC